MSPDGLPHSETCGSKVICTLPQLIAAYRVLHRLREPRHPPCALSYFLVSLSSLLPYAAQAVAHKGQGRRGHFKSCICHTMSKIVPALKKTSRGEYRTRTETDATRHRRRKLSPKKHHRRNPEAGLASASTGNPFPDCGCKGTTIFHKSKPGKSFFSKTFTIT